MVELFLTPWNDQNIHFESQNSSLCTWTESRLSISSFRRIIFLLISNIYEPFQGRIQDFPWEWPQPSQGDAKSLIFTVIPETPAKLKKIGSMGYPERPFRFTNDFHMIFSNSKKTYPKSFPYFFVHWCSVGWKPYKQSNIGFISFYWSYLGLIHSVCANFSYCRDQWE